MVVREHQAALASAIEEQKQQIRKMEREWRPNSAAAAGRPLDEWQDFAADLSSSRLGLEADETFLRRQQQRQWRANERQAQDDAETLRIAVQRSLIDFRREEQNERRAGMAIVHPSIDNKLAHLLGTFELSQRMVRRQAREAQERWPPRPATAPQRRRQRAVPSTPVHGRAPPQNAAVWRSKDGPWAISGSRAPGLPPRVAPEFRARPSTAWA